MSMNKQERNDIAEFLECNNMRIEPSPYRLGSLRIRCDDMLLLIHDAELMDKDTYIDEVIELRKINNETRIAKRVAKVKRMLSEKGVINEC